MVLIFLFIWMTVRVISTAEIYLPIPNMRQAVVLVVIRAAWFGDAKRYVKTS